MNKPNAKYNLFEKVSVIPHKIGPLWPIYLKYNNGDNTMEIKSIEFWHTYKEPKYQGTLNNGYMWGAWESELTPISQKTSTGIPYKYQPDNKSENSGSVKKENGQSPEREGKYKVGQRVKTRALREIYNNKEGVITQVQFQAPKYLVNINGTEIYPFSESTLQSLAEESVQEVSKIEGKPSKKVTDLESAQGQPSNSCKDNPQNLNKVGSDVKNVPTDGEIDTAPEEWKEDYKKKDWSQDQWKTSEDIIDRTVYFISYLSPWNLWKGCEAIRTLLKARDERAAQIVAKHRDGHMMGLIEKVFIKIENEILGRRSEEGKS